MGGGRKAVVKHPVGFMIIIMGILMLILAQVREPAKSNAFQRWLQKLRYVVGVAVIVVGIIYLFI
jgi:hypothetical protein